MTGIHRHDGSPHVIEIEEGFVHSRIDRSSCSQLLSSPFGAPLIEMIETQSPETGEHNAALCDFVRDPTNCES